MRMELPISNMTTTVAAQSAAEHTAADEHEGQLLDRTAFGKRLRAARKKYGLTLAQVSELSGVSIPTISRAERGQLALSYEKFSALGAALHMDMDTLFASQGARAMAPQEPVLTRSGQGVVYKGKSFTYEFLGTTAQGKRMNPIAGTIHARQIEGPEDFSSHPGEEFIYVLSGTVEVHFVSGTVMELGPGDSLYFDSMLGHAYISTGKKLARVIGATLGETRMMQDAREGQAMARQPRVNAPRKKPSAS